MMLIWAERYERMARASGGSVVLIPLWAATLVASVLASTAAPGSTELSGDDAGELISTSVLNVNTENTTGLETLSATLTGATATELSLHLKRNDTVSTAENINQGALLASLLVPAIKQSRECHIHIVYDSHYSSQLGNIAAEIHLHSDAASLQISLWNASAVSTARTSAAGHCRLYLLLLGSPTSLLLTDSPAVLPVGDLWDQAGRYLLVTGADNPGAASAAGGPRGILQNAAFFHVLRERPVLGGGRLSLFSRYDGRTRVLGWVSPSRPMPPLKPPPADFGGRPLKFVSFEHEPTTLYLDGTPTGRLAGVDPYVAQFAARLYNFTLLFSEPSDGLRWGDNGFGYWTGLVGDMVQRRAHFGMANLFITQPRSQIIDFSRPYDFEQACFVVWQPPPLPRWLALLRPFSASGWAAAGALLAVSALTVLALGRAAAPRESPLFSQPGFVALYSLGGLVGVSHASLPRAASGQIFMGTWRFCALTLAVVYSSKLIANLTVPLAPAPLDTKQELALSGVTVSGYGSMFGELLNASTNYWDRRLALNYEPTYDIRAALRRTYDHKGTYIVNSMSLAYLIRKYYTTVSGEPLLRIMRQCFGSFMVGIALPRRSFLTPLLNAAVSRLTEAGLMQHWSRSALRSVGRQLAVGDESPDQPARDAEGRLSRLGLEALQGPFLLLMIGWAAALLSLVAEIAVKRCRRRVSRTG